MKRAALTIHLILATADTALGNPKLRRTAFRVLVGTFATILVAWGCALWTPSRSKVDPMFQNPLEAHETVDPDNETALHYEENGFGWKYSSVRGYLTEGNSGAWWTGPYGGTYHRVAGWPFPALRSRVEVLDSQIVGRVFESEGEPASMGREQRRRWELPWKEIFFRGIASKDLPAWLEAQPGRRLLLRVTLNEEDSFTIVWDDGSGHFTLFTAEA